MWLVHPQPSCLDRLPAISLASGVALIESLGLWFPTWWMRGRSQAITTEPAIDGIALLASGAMCPQISLDQCKRPSGISGWHRGAAAPYALVSISSTTLLMCVTNARSFDWSEMRT